MQTVKIGNVSLGGHLAKISEEDFIKRIGLQLDKTPIFKGRTAPQKLEWLKAAYKTVKDANHTKEVKQVDEVKTKDKEGVK